MVDVPALDPQELADLPIAIATILLGQPDQGDAQIVIVPVFYFIAQGAACGPKNSPKRTWHVRRSEVQSF